MASGTHFLDQECAHSEIEQSEPANMTTSQTKLDQSIQTGLFDEIKLIQVSTPVAALTFEEKVAGAVEAIKEQVREGRHIAQAWSSGKDSSVCLNLAFTALRELKAEGVTVPTLHVIHANTKLENPAVELYTKSQIKAIEAYAESTGISTRVWIASPNLSNDYLVGLLAGRTIMSVGNISKMPAAYEG